MSTTPRKNSLKWLQQITNVNESKVGPGTKESYSWKVTLKQMKLDNLKETAPGFFHASGGYTMKITPYKDSTANGLTRCIIDYINFKGGYANRINTQGQVRKERVELAFGNHRDIVRFTPSTTNRGTADIHATIKGRHVSIEVKIGNDRLSLHQLKEMDRITKAGGMYFVAKDMPSFLTWYEKHFTA